MHGIPTYIYRDLLILANIQKIFERRKCFLKYFYYLKDTVFHGIIFKVWYRVPEGYRAVKGRTWRTLVIFGGRNCAGSNEVSNAIGWARWADRHGVFLVAPGFRDDAYWEPQRWSGRALLAVRIPERGVTLPALNAAFAALWRAAGEIGGAA